jgi:hypothetical protein
MWLERPKLFLRQLYNSMRNLYNGLIVKTKNKVFYNEPICM